ncbi:MAG: hypothetical protein GY870_14715 [archaeon]|nr:hypothetical protein [archaeon]
MPPPKMTVPWDEVKPNRGHYAIVELQNMGIMKFSISQNVDGLHLDSGIHEDKIAEFHGNRNLMVCMECDKKFVKKEIWDRKKWGQGWRTSRVRKTQPNCTECGGRIVNSIVNFGDIIPQKELQLSYDHSNNSDVFFVVGSLLAVVPAANMPRYAIRNGAKLIIINNMATSYDRHATVLFKENTGETLTTILKKVNLITGK